ncbi:hypothetical protein BS47DRAFT_1273421, partial [Hydnum rufescens UP504]
YALTLIDALMKEVPSHCLVGLLCNITCQLHCALLKWNYLDSWLPQLHFGTSMFSFFLGKYPLSTIYY